MAKPAGIKYAIVFKDIEHRKNGLFAIFQNAADKKGQVALTEEQVRMYLSGSDPMPYPFSDFQLLRALGAFRDHPRRKPPKP